MPVPWVARTPLSQAVEGDAWPWPDLDHARAAELVARHLSIIPARLEPLGHGDFCLAFQLGSEVVRVARHAEAAAALEREACSLPMIAPRLPLPVPRPAYHAPPACPPFTRHAGITGDELTRERWLAMMPEQRQRAAADLAALLRALHDLPLDAGHACALPRLDAASLANGLRVPVVDTLGPLLDAQTRQRLDTFLAEVAERPAQRPVLLHGDVAPGHVLYDPDTARLTGVIDFGDLAIGDPARDFVYVYEDFGPELLDAVLRDYAGREASRLLVDTRMWYLLETVAWTVARHDAGEDRDEGLSVIRREITTGFVMSEG